MKQKNKALFYLGTHMTNWLSEVSYPLFISDRRLRVRKGLPRANCRWALDSGGFTELSMNGTWQTTAVEYSSRVRRYSEEIGRLDWAAPQDWMCEPQITKRTGLTVQEHQARTIDSVERLRDFGLNVNFVPVLQGWSKSDYLRHIDMYTQRGFDLASEPVVGVGTVCRRQATSEAEDIIKTLSGAGISIHAFGFKKVGLMKCNQHLYSADSMAWSFNARYDKPLEGCTHKNCANCLKYANLWRDSMLDTLSYQNGKTYTFPSTPTPAQY
jgi:hypothetical protein